MKKGRGRPLSLALARRWYEQAAALGQAKSACALGNLMVNGQGGAKDPRGGLARCRDAAARGDPDAQTDYAGYLLTGVGSPRDPVAAREHLTAAAESGHINAAMLLGTIYWNGDGTPKDRLAAERWWHKAYSGGRKDAAKHIADAAYLRMMGGVRGPQDIRFADLQETMRWYALASQDPDPARRAEAAKQLGLLKSFSAALRTKQ